MQHEAINLKRPAVRWLRLLLLAALMFYVLVCIGYAVFQRRLIYLPPHFTAEQVDRSAQDAGLERWKNPAGQAIGMERLFPGRAAIARVLLVYGQASWSVGCAHYAQEIQSVAPVDVFILEYPGYADRTGPPSEQSFFQSATQALQWLGTNQPVYLIGESLGSGVAAYLAGTYPDKIAGVILLSPYDRLATVGQYRMPFLPVSLILADRFPSEDYLRDYHGPLGVMVDGRDRVVPERFGKRLFDSYAGPKQLWRFPDGGHVQIPQPKAKFWGQVVDFWQMRQNSTNVTRHSPGRS